MGGDQAESPPAPDVDLERRRLLAAGAGLAALGGGLAAGCETPPSRDRGFDIRLRAAVRNVVVIYAENRSFDNLLGAFPGLQDPWTPALPSRAQQLDRDGRPLPVLPPIWGGLVPQAQTLRGERHLIGQSGITGLPNAPFELRDLQGRPLGLDLITRDLEHRFYQNQMQINGGRNDGFVAWGDSGALVMGRYVSQVPQMRLWALARDYTLCDRFFMAGFGGSWLNHMMLIAGRPPHYPDAAQSPARHRICRLEGEDPAGVRLKLAAGSPASALDGPPKFERDSSLTPDGYGVNSMAPPYQPSYVRPAAGGDRAWADPSSPSVMPPQTYATIGDRLGERGVDWAWYAGAWGAALASEGSGPVPNFQPHHQPFNYFAGFAPGTPARARHLRDAGVGNTAATNRFLADIDAGRLPPVAFYKPQGNLNLHAGYADIASGDGHLGTVVDHLRRGPQWHQTLVVITFDENGGWWDHVAPPRGDRWGPGSRIPAILVSPHARRGFVDHTLYDTASILRFLTRLHDLRPLPAVQDRDAAMAARGQAPLGDLTNALEIA